jgi:RNA polymerase sporulation-specific sigma factor
VTLRKPEPKGQEAPAARVFDLYSAEHNEQLARQRAEECERLVIANQSLVHGWVQTAMERYRLPESLRDDLVSAGHRGLIQAADRFDPSRGVKFKTFAARVVSADIIDTLRTRDGAREVTEVSLDGFASEQPSPEKQAITAQELKCVRETVQELNTRERALIEAHYGRGLTLREAADELGISRSYASRVHARAIETIRNRHDLEDEMEQERER